MEYMRCTYIMLRISKGQVNVELPYVPTHDGRDNVMTNLSMNCVNSETNDGCNTAESDDMRADNKYTFTLLALR